MVWNSSVDTYQIREMLSDNLAIPFPIPNKNLREPDLALPKPY